MILHRATSPRIALLGNLPGATLHRNIEQYPEATIVPGILIVRVDSAIFFSNSNCVRESFKKMIAVSVEYKSLWKSELRVEVSSTYFCPSVLTDVTADTDEDDVDVKKVVSCSPRERERGGHVNDAEPVESVGGAKVGDRRPQKTP
ncbi:hypothetical protein B296_00011093 [Ensete ventricosum]|uniref:STAS domain-containing protein n=1 Tax=Ensete ventricosum TaxID=4639 RepID=A0A427B1F9_ENSVE|nr:hypothetical protein B296_00011093 [Ensete ventricosum]